MLTLSTAASLGYYLAGSSDPEGFGILDTDSAQVGYYNRRLDSDPLARPGIWFGFFAEQLGLESGSAVDNRDFASLYFGRHPGTGNPLTEDMPSIADQQAASKRKAEAEAELVAAQRELNRARSEARANGGDLDLDSGVMAARDRMSRARATRKSVSGEIGSRQPAHDLTFGAPKDVSVLLMALHAEGRTVEAMAIEQAFVRSVQAAMTTIEKDFLLDRPRDGEGRRNLQAIGGCATALFTHFDARPVDGLTDPHLHIHAVVFSPVQTIDGDIRSVYTRYLNDNQHTLGAMQRALFAAELKALGYAVAPDIQEKISSFSLQGMTAQQRSAFSQRAAQVEAAHRDGLTGRAAKMKDRAAKFDRLDGQGMIDLTGKRLADIGLTADQIAAPVAELHRREWLDRRMSQAWEEERKAIRAHTKSYTRGPSPGTPAWNRKIDRLLEQAQQRIKTAVPDTPEAILESCLAMEARFGIRDIERRVWEAAAHADIPISPVITPQQAIQTWGKDMIRKILSHPDLMQVQYGTPDQPAFGPQGLDPFGLPVFTTRSQRERESDVYGRILPELAAATSFTTMGASQAELAIDAWEANQDPARPIHLSPNQRQAIADLITSPSRLHVVSSWAGTGKTLMANAAVAMLSGMGVEVLAVAPSNAAAEGLRKEIGATAAHTPESLALAIANGSLALKPNMLLYIDEASMLDFAETRTLLDAVHRSGGKVVFQGDAKQLQSVGMGNVLKRILSMPECQLGIRPRLVSHLTQKFSDHIHIQRQKHTWAKQVIARAELGHVVRAFDELDRRGFVSRHIGEEDMLRSAVNGYMEGAKGCADISQLRQRLDQARGNGDKLAVAEARFGIADQHAKLSAFYRERLMIASTNTRVHLLNKLARESLKAAGLLDAQEVMLSGHKGKPLAVALGERLVFTEKATHGDIRFEGGGKDKVVKSVVGTVIEIRQQQGSAYLRLQLDDGRRIEVDSRNFAGLDHAYAMSVHKSQGISVSKVEFVGSTFNNAELMLVGLSRFRDQLRIHTVEHEVEALRNSCARVTDKLEANDLHAEDLGFITSDERATYKQAAAMVASRMDGLMENCPGQTDRLLPLPPTRDPMAERIKAFIDSQQRHQSAPAVQQRVEPILSRESSATHDPEIRLPANVREASWSLIDAALANQAVLTQLHIHLGLTDEKTARRRWTGKADDIIDWREQDDGGPAWQVGRQIEGGEVELSGVVLADDGQRVYFGVAIHGSEGAADAHTRILAVGKETLGDSLLPLPIGGAMRMRVRDGEIWGVEPISGPVQGQSQRFLEP